MSISRFLKSPRARLCFAMAVFGTLGPFVRNIPLSSGELALYRAVLAFLLITAYLVGTGSRIPFREIRREIPLLLVSGAAMGFNWILLFEAYKYTTISAATLSYYFAPVIVTLVSSLLFREKLTAGQKLCFAMATLGIVLITIPQDFFQGFPGGRGDGRLLNAGGSLPGFYGLFSDTGAGNVLTTNLRGIMFGLGAACLYASVILFNKAIKKVDGIHRTLLQFGAAILVLTPYVAASGSPSLSALDGKGLICLLVVGLFHTGVNYCLYFSSLGGVPGQEAAILSYTDPLTAVLISFLLLGEPMTLPQMIGGAMILGFTLWNEL